MTTLIDLKLRNFDVNNQQASDEEVIDYLEELIAKGLTYDFYFGVDDVDWSSQLTQEGIANIIKNHNALMAHMECRYPGIGIYEFFEDYPELSEKYSNYDE
jgi:hypothetical protein